MNVTLRTKSRLPALAVLLLVSSVAAPIAHYGLSATLNQKREVKLFLIAREDDGKTGKKIGCNDSVVAINQRIVPTKAPLGAVLKELLRLPEKAGQSGNLYNALHGSKLRLKRVYIRRGEARIYLSGMLATGGVCDSPRVKAQIEETALQFSTVKRVKVFINGTPLDDHLSEKD